MLEAPVSVRNAVWKSKIGYVRKMVVRDRYLYMLLLPVLAFYIIFKYLPMYGIIIAFKNFRFADGIWGSTWIGFKHFEQLLSSPEFFRVIKNTMQLNVFGLIFGFPIPIILAILLNEVRHGVYKRTLQSLLYIPHFISWVVLGGILIAVASPSTGIINIVLNRVFGIEPIYFLVNSFWWVVFYVLSGIWQSAGWGTIIYLASISGIDQDLYEAAEIDGASKLRQTWHITLPCIRGTIAILLVLRMGHMMNIGFEHIYVLQNSAIRHVSDVISTYEYRIGLENFQYSYTTAVGLFQSLINLVLILGADKVTKYLGEEGLW